MRDEPLAREREPIERDASRGTGQSERRPPLRCSIQADRQALPSGSHAERPVQGSRRQEYWAADAGGPRAAKRARWKHGYYSREAKAERSRVRAAMLALRYLRNSI